MNVFFLFTHSCGGRESEYCGELEAVLHADVSIIQARAFLDWTDGSAASRGKVVSCSQLPGLCHILFL